MPLRQAPSSNMNLRPCERGVALPRLSSAAKTRQSRREEAAGEQKEEKRDRFKAKAKGVDPIQAPASECDGRLHQRQRRRRARPGWFRTSQRPIFCTRGLWDGVYLRLIAVHLPLRLFCLAAPGPLHVQGCCYGPPTGTRYCQHAAQTPERTPYRLRPRRRRKISWHHHQDLAPGSIPPPACQAVERKIFSGLP